MSSRGRSVDRPTARFTGRQISKSESRAGTNSTRTGKRAASEKGTRSSKRPQSAGRGQSSSGAEDSNNRQVADPNDPCVCGPDFYTNVLGPTADETILVGLQTFLNFCTECPANAEGPSDDGEGDNEEYEEEEELENSSCQSVESQTICPRLRLAICQTGRMSDNCSQTSSSSSNECSQTQQPHFCHDGSQSKYFRSTPSQMIRCHVKHTESQANVMNKCRSTHVHLKCQKSKSHSHRSKANKSGSTTASCTCCQCSSATLSAVESGICTCCISKAKPTRICSIMKSRCLCNAGNTTTPPSGGCSCATGVQKRHVKVRCNNCCTTNSTPTTCCTCTEEEPTQSGDTRESRIRYAVTKITKFYSFTTFEVMKSTKKKPKVMPKSLEGVFVLKNVATS